MNLDAKILNKTLSDVAPVYEGRLWVKGALSNYFQFNFAVKLTLLFKNRVGSVKKQKTATRLTGARGRDPGRWRTPVLLWPVQVPPRPSARPGTPHREAHAGLRARSGP